MRCVSCYVCLYIASECIREHILQGNPEDNLSGLLSVLYDSQGGALCYFTFELPLSLPLSYLIELKSNAAIINQANVQLEDFKSDLEAKLPH